MVLLLLKTLCRNNKLVYNTHIPTYCYLSNNKPSKKEGDTFYLLYTTYINYVKRVMKHYERYVPELLLLSKTYSTKNFIYCFDVPMYTYVQLECEEFIFT